MKSLFAAVAALSLTVSVGYAGSIFVLQETRSHQPVVRADRSHPGPVDLWVQLNTLAGISISCEDGDPADIVFVLKNGEPIACASR